MMSLLRKILRRIDEKSVLAIFFLFVIFFTGSSVFVSTLKNSFALTHQQNYSAVKELSVMRSTFIEDYENMLDFKSKGLRNKGFYVNMNGLLARAMGQRHMNDRVKLDNGHLASIAKPRNVNKSVEQLSKLYMAQKEQNKAFLLVIAPAQIPAHVDIVPTGFVDFSNQNADALLERLEEVGVPTLDLRKKMLEDGIDFDDAFFVTDHHWTSETGFWAYTGIVDYMENRFDMRGVDPYFLDLQSYHIDIYEDCFLGSSGKRTGKYYAGVDDFSLITPTFSTHITVNIDHATKNLEGPFEDVVYNLNRLKTDYFNANPYGLYSHGDKGYIRYNNDQAPLAQKAMLIGDSYANAPFGFLSLVIRDIIQLDMRYFKGNFEEIYRTFEPDIVIVLLGTVSVADQNARYEYIA